MHGRTTASMFRTNNQFEGWNTRMHKLMECEHPSLWKFFDKLKLEEANVRIHVIQAGVSQQPPSQQQRYAEYNQRLLHLLEHAHADLDRQINSIAHNIKL
ncbi:unnamed protein product [Didymodactylos carnosus]|uniref:Uncharacterized protein n=1 Tax=Didymodactylos carnosus TaxID=1234261 RepID=A0A815SZG1_9BILA|nr:unnamed protein product [Didymodactylos carnosus]CAF1497438.1 unnamed protein product [Didymodactylos carnosus]CAF4164184.1 unnamed protein product [Didymodactylos carnosus]CAF4359627.1 unnamed protein product [Didymodactylos carnosus]